MNRKMFGYYKARKIGKKCFGEKSVQLKSKLLQTEDHNP